jgi:hypothetical protein
VIGKKTTQDTEEQAEKANTPRPESGVGRAAAHGPGSLASFGVPPIRMDRVVEIPDSLARYRVVRHFCHDCLLIKKRTCSTPMQK